MVGDHQEREAKVKALSIVSGNGIFIALQQAEKRSMVFASKDSILMIEEPQFEVWRFRWEELAR